MNRRGFIKSLAALAGVPFLRVQTQTELPSWNNAELPDFQKPDFQRELDLCQQYYLAHTNVKVGQVVYIDSSGGLAPYEPGESPPIGVIENAAKPGEIVKIVFKAKI